VQDLIVGEAGHRWNYTCTGFFCRSAITVDERDTGAAGTI
jgi:hypothetical protein